MRNTSCILSMAALVTILLSLPAALGQCPGPCEGDLDGDGCVDLSDLAALLARYGVCCDQAWLPDESTVALWYLNGNGTDFSGNGNDLIVKEDQVGWVNDAPHCRGVLMGEDGYPGDCFQSDGGALTAPGEGCTYPGSGDWTVEAWVYFPLDTESYGIVYHYSEHWEGHEPYQLGISNGSAFFEINNIVVVSADVSAYKKQWFHLAAVYRYQQDAAIWVNGERMAIEATNEVPEYLPSYHVYLGGNYCGTTTGLKIDEVQISRKQYPSGWLYNPQTEHHYRLSIAGSWQAAEDDAVDAGGHLVTINDPNENEWLLTTFGYAYIELWIGFTDELSEGHWEWIGEVEDPGQHWDGGWWEQDNPDSTSYVNWDDGEPNNEPNEDYALMYGQSMPAPGKWNDRQWHSIPGIIERP